VAGGAGIIVFSFGIPLALILLLRRLNSRDSLRHASVARMLGFLSAGFEPRYYYFESFYMIRKLLFQIIPVAGWLKGRDANATGRLQNGAAAFLAAISCSFHLAFTPYDNRGYFILDRIEQASLQAVIITAFVQLWALDTEDALEEYDPTYKTLSSVVLSLIVIWTHLRFWFMVSWGVVRKFVRGLWDAYTVRFQHLQKGWLKVCPNGLIMESMGPSEELLLTTMFQELVDFQILNTQKIDFDVLLGGFQNIVLRAYGERLQSNVARLDRVSHRFDSAGKLVDMWLSEDGTLSVYAKKLLDSLEKIFGVEHNVKVADKIKAMQIDVDSLEDFSAKNVARTIGQKFSVEELHAAMMLVDGDVEQHSRKIGIAKLAEIHGYRIETIIVTGAKGHGKMVNGDWVPDGLHNGSRLYKTDPDGVLCFEPETSRAAKELGTKETKGKPKWTMFINGQYRYYNVTESVEVPSTGWTAIPEVAKGSPKICPGLNDPNDDRRVESINVIGAKGGKEETGLASDLNGDWAPAKRHHQGHPAYSMHPDGSVCFEDEDSKAGRDLGTPGKAKWTMFINGHYRYYNEQEPQGRDVPSSGWIAVPQYAKGTPTIRPCLYDPEEDPASKNKGDEFEEVQSTMIRQLREELAHANFMIASLSRPGNEDDEDSGSGLEKSEKVLTASNTSSTSLPAVLEAPNAATASPLLDELETPTARSYAGSPTHSHTVVEIRDGEVSEQSGSTTRRLGLDDRDNQLNQARHEQKKASLRVEELEEALKKQRDLVAKWQTRHSEELIKTRRLKEEMEATKKQASEDVEEANALQRKAQEALREAQDALKLELQRKVAGTPEEARREKQAELEAAKEAAKDHLMSSSFVAPAPPAQRM